MIFLIIFKGFCVFQIDNGNSLYLKWIDEVVGIKVQILFVRFSMDYFISKKVFFYKDWIIYMFKVVEF